MGLVIALAIGGIILILAEVFLPGGILGGMGFISIGFSIFFSYREKGIPGLIISSVVLVTAGILTWWLALKLLPKTSAGNDLFLNKTQKGYDTQKEGLSVLIGKSGTVISALRPTGKVEIGGQRYDAVANGEFLSPGADVVVTSLRSNQLVVEHMRKSK